MGIRRHGRNAARVMVRGKSDKEDPKRAPSRWPRQVTEIFTWIQCYASYVSVLSSHFAESVPELMAYMVTITRVSQTSLVCHGSGTTPPSVGRRPLLATASGHRSTGPFTQYVLRDVLCQLNGVSYA